MYKFHVKYFEKLKVLQRQDVQKVCIFGGSLTPIYPLKMAAIQKSRHSQGKKLFIGLSESVKIKVRLYLISIFNEKYNYFLRYLVVFEVRMGLGLKIKRSEVRLASKALD